MFPSVHDSTTPFELIIDAEGEANCCVEGSSQSLGKIRCILVALHFQIMIVCVMSNKIQIPSQ